MENSAESTHEHPYVSESNQRLGDVRDEFPEVTEVIEASYQKRGREEPEEEEEGEGT